MASPGALHSLSMFEQEESRPDTAHDTMCYCPSEEIIGRETPEVKPLDVSEDVPLNVAATDETKNQEEVPLTAVEGISLRLWTDESQKEASESTEDTISLEPTTVTYTRRWRRYVPALDEWYRNSLMAAVGFLDFTNALDFPANVWNQRPIPFFAQILMGFGGSIAGLWAITAICDLLRSRKNIRLLWRERRFLHDYLAKCRGQDKNDLESARLAAAWLQVNVRELGWEYVDRAVMDGFMTVASLLVGAGTLMAIEGDIDVIFDASNLLSGYIGNSFVAAYGVVQACWSIFMWRRAHHHLQTLSKTKIILEPDLRQRMRTQARKHQVFAIGVGVTVLVSGAGSLVSATLWPGYVILLPCVFASVFCNLFWRHKVGYNRPSFEQWAGGQDFDIHEKLQMIHSMQSVLASKSRAEFNLEEFAGVEEEMSSQDIVLFSQNYLLLHDLGAALLNTRGKNEISAEQSGGRTILASTNLIDLKRSDLACAARTSILEKGKYRLRDQERFLLELYGCYLAVVENENESAPNRRNAKERNHHSRQGWDTCHGMPSE